MSKSVKYGGKRRSMMKKRKVYPSKKNNARKQRITKKRMRGAGLKQNDTFGNKNILLIIDPQNDFTPKYGNQPRGSLAVDGSIEDYTKMIEMIKNKEFKFDEIHISLDTHTPNHIGHVGFWMSSDQNLDWDSLDWVEATSDNDILRTLHVKDGRIIGKSILDYPERYYKPRNVELNKYVIDYINFFVDEDDSFVKTNAHKLKPWIWPDHCVEGSPGHEIYAPLKDELDKLKGKVFYHLKGQNNLAEMYSIFSAEYPVQNKYEKYTYNGGKQKTPYPTVYNDIKFQDYNQIIQCNNLNTYRNIPLLERILKTEKRAYNNVYICGQARTHCVKSSIIDMFEYLKQNPITGDSQLSRINMITNMSSPIGIDIEELPNFTNMIKSYKANTYTWINNDLVKN